MASPSSSSAATTSGYTPLSPRSTTRAAASILVSAAAITERAAHNFAEQANVCSVAVDQLNDLKKKEKKKKKKAAAQYVAEAANLLAVAAHYNAEQANVLSVAADQLKDLEKREKNVASFHKAVDVLHVTVVSQLNELANEMSAASQGKADGALAVKHDCLQLQKGLEGAEKNVRAAGVVFARFAAAGEEDKAERESNVGKTAVQNVVAWAPAWDVVEEGTGAVGMQKSDGRWE